MELDYKAIGTRIAQRRKQLGLKQSEVEEAADIGFKYLSNIERGISIPSTEVIMRLALALDTTPDGVSGRHGAAGGGRLEGHCRAIAADEGQTAGLGEKLFDVAE